MIIDICHLLNEFDVLKIRLHELDKAVDKFVIVESVETFSGVSRTLNRIDQLIELAPSPAKIVHAIISERSSGSHWDREKFQRNKILSLVEIGNDDTIIYSDVDEVPRASVVAACGVPSKLILAQYQFKLNLVRDDLVTGRAAVVRGAEFKRVTPAGIRGIYYTQRPNAGWHFQRLARTPAAVIDQLKASSHCDEPSTRKIIADIGNGMSAQAAFGDKLMSAPMRDMPEYVRQNYETYMQLGLLDFSQ